MEEKNPFDLSKALAGASIERLNPEVSKFRLNTDLSYNIQYYNII